MSDEKSNMNDAIDRLIQDAINAYESGPEFESQLPSKSELVEQYAVNAYKHKPDLESQLPSKSELVEQFAANAFRNKPDLESQLPNDFWISEAKNRMQLCNRLVNQAYLFRAILFYFLLSLMVLETVFLFVTVLLTSVQPQILKINDLTLQIITGATIIQISTMVIVIIHSVYPKDIKQLIDISKEISHLK